MIAYGRSQPGRFLREFVRLGFNQDLNGGQVFDGIYASIAGSRRIFLNEPFAQPGRFHRQQEDHLYPGDQFPFSYATRTDSVSDKTDGILARSLATNTCPKIIHVDSSTEFWLGRSSLVVTDEHGEDIEVPDEVRVFLFSGTGHAGPIMLDHAAVFSQNPAYAMNFLNYNPLNRSLLIALDQWATQGIAPPDSRVPRSGDGTLVPPSPQAETGFPAIPGVHHPERVNELSAMDYSQQPPVPVSGKAYRVLVPKVDADGNELAGIHLPAISVPLGTHTGWNLRGAGFSPGALMLVGSYFPVCGDKKRNDRPTATPDHRWKSAIPAMTSTSLRSAALSPSYRRRACCSPRTWSATLPRPKPLQSAAKRRGYTQANAGRTSREVSMPTEHEKLWDYDVVAHRSDRNRDHGHPHPWTHYASTPRPPNMPGGRNWSRRTM